MTLLCERCYGSIDPEQERFYRLAHLSHADASGNVVWNDATVHSDPCGPALQFAGGRSRHGRAA